MSDESSRIQRTVWAGLGLTFLIIVGLFVLTRLKPKEAALPVYGPVTDFTLTNQFNEPVHLATFKDKIWIANIIFTSCPGPCTQMTQRMREIQAALPAGAPVQLVSLTTDPQTDTPEVLKQYAQRFGADTGRWIFLTGPKREIAKLAGTDGLKLTAIEKSVQERTSENDLFIHSTVSVFVDQKGQVRGTVEVLEPGAKEKSLEIVNRLLAEGT